IPTTEALMAKPKRITHYINLRDPISGKTDNLFGCGPELRGEWVAEVYMVLALKYEVTFKEIIRMAMVALHGPEAWANDFNIDKLDKIMRDLIFDAERDHELMDNFKLPLAEYLKIWLRGREALLRYAQWFPDKREGVEAFLAEQEAEMIALVERAEKRRTN